jgi:hypothetical protein
MSNADYAHACELIRSLPAETVLKIAGMCDGLDANECTTGQLKLKPTT